MIIEICKEYFQIKSEDWIVLKDGEVGRTIRPISYTGESEEASVIIIDEELEGMKDDNGDIQFFKVTEFCLPCFDTDNGVVVGLWELQAVHMRNYMVHLMDPYGFKPSTIHQNIL